jgi:hypothetical protein
MMIVVPGVKPIGAIGTVMIMLPELRSASAKK